jgi:hypothetical protein
MWSIRSPYLYPSGTGCSGYIPRHSFSSPPTTRRATVEVFDPASTRGNNSESELLYDRRFTANEFVLATSPLTLPTSNYFQLNTCGHSPYVTCSLTRGWHGSDIKHRFYYCMFCRCRGNNVPTELFPSNGCCTVASLHSRYVAMSLHVTICSNEWSEFHSESCKGSDKQKMKSSNIIS